MKAIFLSASIPDPRRDPAYYGTADLIAIRDAVRALATVVLPHAALYWGGHPAITPLIRVVAENVGIVGKDRVRLFQSEWFSDALPDDNEAFESCELIPKRATREESLAAMRDRMLSAASFDAAIFIGGMEGVEEEFALFTGRHPDARLLPVASTGAAAAIIYEREREVRGFSDDLLLDYAYPSLFRRRLKLPVGGTRG